jgi:hypothetical protein
VRRVDGGGSPMACQNLLNWRQIRNIFMIFESPTLSKCFLSVELHVYKPQLRNRSHVFRSVRRKIESTISEEMKRKTTQTKNK